jgi:hypothetical protein
MTPDEWGRKLLNDISERPEYYFARVEIARLDSDLSAMLDEMWDVQKVMKDAQNRDRWYQTVSRDSCNFCPYFGLCSSRWDTNSGEVPEGFVETSIHPELEEVVQ